MFKASLAFNRGQFSQTENLLTQALTSLPTTDIMTPQRAGVLRSLADILVRQGHSAEALIYTKLLAEAFPGAEDAKSRYQQALALFREKRFTEAENSLNQLLQEYPQMEQAAQLLGIINYIKGDLQQASAYFAEHLDPETAPETMTQIAAMTNMRLREPDRVLALLQDQITDDSSPQILAMYGLAALAAREFERDEAALLRAVKADPTLTRLRLALAAYYNGKQPREPEKALTQLKIAYAQNDGDPLIQAAMVQYYLQAGQQTEASKLINAVLRKHPDTDTSYILAADFYRSTGKADTAVTHYEKAVALNPQNNRNLMKLGLAQLGLKNPAAAGRAYRKAIDIAPENNDGYKGLISAYELAGEVDKAIDEIIGLSRADDNPVPAAVLAEYYARRGNFEQANLFEQQVISAAPDARPTKALTSAIAYAETNHWLRQSVFDKARQSAHRGLIANSRSLQLLRGLAQTEILDGKYAEAQKVIEQISELSQPLAHHLSGDLHRAQADTAMAISAYERAWAMAPNDLIGSKLYTLHKGQSASEATAFLTSWIENFPRSIRAKSLRSEEKMARSDFKSAIRDLESILESQPRSPVVLNNLAWAYHQTGNKRAISTARQAYELAPDNAAVADTYGWVLLKNGQTSAALDILRKAAALAPENEEIQQHLREAESGG